MNDSLVREEFDYNIAIFKKLAGSASSGNFGHGGRQGKVGGSTSKTMAQIANFQLADYNGAQLAEQQRLVSIANGQRLLDKFDKERMHTEVRRDQLEHWVDRLEEHRSLILEEAVMAQKEGLISLTPAERKDLERRLVYHDMDKYDWSVAEPYIMGGLFSKDRSLRDDDAYKDASKAAVRKHHEINDHHPRYWNKREMINGKETYRPTPMSNVAVAEMVGDLRGTSREKGTDVNQWYARHRDTIDVHPQTQKQLDRAFSFTPSKRDGGDRDRSSQSDQARTMSEILSGRNQSAKPKPAPTTNATRRPQQKRAGPITKYQAPLNDDLEFDFDAKPQKRKKKSVEEYEALSKLLDRF